MFFSIQNHFKCPFTSTALTFKLSFRIMMFEILTFFEVFFIVIAKSIIELAMR